jgi:predicted amidophosphoribosyltransferase
MTGTSKPDACPECRTPVSGDEDACPNCGATLGPEAELSTMQRETDDRPDPSP